MKRASGSLLAGSLLRAIAAPYKLTYVSDQSIAEKLNAHNKVQLPKTEEAFRWRQQITSAADFDEDQELEADVVIIGTGAGGAAAAYELANRGLAVVLIEEGAYFTRKDFTGNQLEMGLKLYRGAPITVGNTFMPIPIGKTVGGSTTVNSGTSMRAPDWVLDEWEQEGLVELSTENLSPYYDAVAEIINVEQADPKYVGELGNVIKKGANAIGMIDAQPLTRNAKGCDGQALCVFGCPTDAKQSTNVSYIPRALDSGAFLFTEFAATELINEGKATKGVIAQGVGSEGKPIKLTIRASKTIVAMGTLLSPVFLQKNGVKHPKLGRNLSVHPAATVFAWYPGKNFDNARTIPQGFGVMDLKKQGITFEGGTLPLLVHGMVSNHMADEYVQFVERYQEIGYFSFMIRETSRGRVRPGLTKIQPFISYFINKHDKGLITQGIDHVARMHFKAGAKEVYIPGLTKLTVLHSEQELDAFLAKKPSLLKFSLVPFHPLGTVRVGVNAEQGVCDLEHKVYGHEGLYVMDGSSVPTPLAANPQMTIMAMASRAAEKMADTLLGEAQKTAETAVAD